MATHRRRFLLPAFLVSFLVVACSNGSSGSSGSSSPQPRDSAFPATVNAANGSVRIEQRPVRIVSMSATATEMLFAIDAGSQVVAVDSTSNYPADAPTTGLNAYQPNVEAIAKFDPDLVVISNDPGDLEKSLGGLHIDVLVEPAAANIADTYEQIEELGAATGNAGDAEDLVASMRSQIETIVDSAPTVDSGDSEPTFYYELDPTFYSVTSKTFIGQLYQLVGLRNIADAAKGGAPDYPQLSAEYIVDADPDMIFLADTECCDQSIQTVQKRPGWDQITAVKTGAVVPLDDDVASRWGPRIVDLLRTIVKAASDLEPAST